MKRFLLPIAAVALCVAAVIILYSVARNLPCFPFLAPH